MTAEPKHQVLRLRKKHAPGSHQPPVAADGERLVRAQSLLHAAMAAFIAIVIFAVIWSMLTAAFGRIFPWMTMLLGVLVGFAVTEFVCQLTRLVEVDELCHGVNVYSPYLSQLGIVFVIQLPKSGLLLFVQMQLVLENLPRATADQFLRLHDAVAKRLLRLEVWRERHRKAKNNGG